MAAIKTEIQLYFDLGLSQKEIHSMLAYYDRVIISERHLMGILSGMKLYRRIRYTDLFNIALLGENELSKSEQLHGYRWMHLK